MAGFHRRGPEIDLELSEAEADLLGLAPVILAAPLPAPAGEPPSRYPYFRAHPGDGAAQARFRELTAGSLESDREADRRRYVVSLERGTLGPEDAAAWLRVLAEARLALAARLGGSEADGPEGPRSPGSALLHLYGGVQDELATTLLGP